MDRLIKQKFTKLAAKFISLKENSRSFRFFIIYITPFISTTLLIVIRRVLIPDFNLAPFLLFTFLVVLHSIVGNVTSGTLATLWSTILVSTFLIYPYNSFKFDGLILIQAIAFIVQSIIIVLFVNILTKYRAFVAKINRNLSTGPYKLRTIIDNVFNLIAITTIDGTILEINKTYSDLLSDQTKSVLGENIIESEIWESNAEAASRLNSAIKNISASGTIKYEDRLNLDDKKIDVEINISPIEQENTTPQLIISINDISSRKLYERELKQSQDILSKLIDSNIIGMVIGNTEGKILETNDAFLNMIGYAPEDFIEHGIYWDEIMDDEFEEVSDEKILDQGHSTPKEKILIHKDGNRIPVMLSGVLINKSKGTIFHLIVDLSLAKEVERKKDEFISIASHELKTPMTILKGYLQIFNKKILVLEPSMSQPLKLMEVQVDKLNKLINELNDMVKLETNKLTISKEKFNIVEMLKTVIQEIKPMVDNQNITLDFDKQEIFVEADQQRISQVVTNFLTNAIKFTKEDGNIKVNVTSDDKTVTVKVKDDGIGISKENLDNIFKKYYQVENKSSIANDGMGIGLYLSSQIIKKHSGKIGVESHPNEGATFYFELPVCAG